MGAARSGLSTIFGYTTKETAVIPEIGRIVHYTLNGYDADMINRRREDSRSHMGEHRDNSNGVILHMGNPVKVGDVYPLIITRVWAEHPVESTSVNGQVLLDGNDSLWVSSIQQGEGQQHWLPHPPAWETVP